MRINNCKIHRKCIDIERKVCFSGKVKRGIGAQVIAYLVALVQCAQMNWVGIPQSGAARAETQYHPANFSVPFRHGPSFEAEPVQLQYEPAIAEPSHIAEPQEAPLFAIPRELPATGETVSALVSAGMGGTVELGDASITIPPNALEADTEITITRLLITGDTGEVHNATAGGGGYRFLPEGQQFLAEAVIRLPYGKELEGKPAMLEELTTYYYDTELRRWEALRRIGLDEERGQLVSVTTHFTDMINGTLTLPEGPEPLSFNINSIKGLEAADPSAGVLPLEGLEANSMGSAGFRFALSVPAGRAGMAPQVAVGYSSEGGNGVLGKGWSLEAGGEVTYDTRRGLPEYRGEESKKGPFLLDGVVLELKGQSGQVYRYEPLKESGFEQIRHYTGTSDYWEVTDKRGTVRTYGKRAGQGEYGPSWTGQGADAKYRWLLESIEDSFGNRIRYEYKSFEDRGELYISDIFYTEHKDEGTIGPYQVHFEYGAGRKDIAVNGRGKFIAETKRQLDRIVMYYDGAYIRGYRVEYKNQQYFGYTQLVTFGEEENGSGEYRWAYEFEYEDMEMEGGKPVLFSDAKRWNFSGAIQEQHGENGGSTGTISGGIGVGPS